MIRILCSAITVDHKNSRVFSPLYDICPVNLTVHPTIGRQMSIPGPEVFIIIFNTINIIF